MLNGLGKSSKKNSGGGGGGNLAYTTLIRMRVNLTKWNRVSDKAFCSALFFLLFAQFHIFEELYKKCSWNHVWSITQNAATQLGHFYGPKLQIWKASGSYKEAKSTKKMGKCSNSKMFLVISHHLLTVSSFIIYQFIISPQNRKLPSCIGLTKPSLPFYLSGTVKVSHFPSNINFNTKHLARITSEWQNNSVLNSFRWVRYFGRFVGASMINYLTIILWNRGE